MTCQTVYGTLIFPDLSFQTNTAKGMHRCATHVSVCEHLDVNTEGEILPCISANCAVPSVVIFAKERKLFSPWHHPLYMKLCNLRKAYKQQTVYVEIKCQLDATEFLLQVLLLAQHVSGTTMPIIRSSRVLYSGCCLWYMVLWFSSCCSGVELRVMCPVCRMLTVKWE